MDDDRRGRDGRNGRPAVTAPDNGRVLAQEADRIEGPLEIVPNDLALGVLVDGISGTGHDLGTCNAVLNEGLKVFPGIWAAFGQPGHGLWLSRRQLAVACGGHDRGQGHDLVRMFGCQHLGDHAAHGGTDNVRLVPAQGIHHTCCIGRHIGEQVGHRGLLAGHQGLEDLGHVGGTVFLELVGQADIAVVIPRHPIATGRQVVDKVHGPGGHLGT